MSPHHRSPRPAISMRSPRSIITLHRELPAPDDLRATWLLENGDEWLVLSYPLSPPPAPATVQLTAAERSVLDGIVAGHSNAGIARARGTATRTVANQVASIFQKLGVASRVELLSALFGTPARDDERGG